MVVNRSENSELNSQSIRYAVYRRTAGSFREKTLDHFGLRFITIFQGCVNVTDLSTPKFEVLVIEADAVPAAADDPQVRQLMQQARAADLGVCVVVHDDVRSALELLAAGADSVGFFDDAAPAFAVAVFAAHNAAVVRRTLSGRVAELERKIEQDRIVGQARSILAEQLRISETQALKQIRHEARNQRRSMADVAKVIVEAQQILKRVSRNSDGVSVSMNGDGRSLPSEGPASLPLLSSIGKDHLSHDANAR